MTNDKPFEILYIKVTPDIGGQSYAAGSTIKINFAIRNNTTLYASRAYYNYSFGYMDGTGFIVWDTPVEDVATDTILEPGEIAEYTIDYVIPTTEYVPTGSLVPLIERSTYCFEMSVYPSNTHHMPGDLWGEVHVRYSSIFSVKTLSSGYLMHSFSLNTSTPITCDINHPLGTITGTVPYNTSLIGKIATFTLSENASAAIGATPQVSGVTVNDFDSPLTYTVTSEDGLFTKDYVVTISVEQKINGGGFSMLALYSPKGMSSNPIKVGQTVKIYCSVGNNSDADYNPDSGPHAVIYVEYQHPVTSAWIMVPKANIPLDKIIPGRSEVDGVKKVNYVTVSSSWKVTDNIPYGENYGEDLRFRLRMPQTSSELEIIVDVIREYPFVRTFAISERLGLLQGERTYYSNNYLRLNNDLYCAWIDEPNVGDTGLKQLIYRKMDYPESYELHGDQGQNTIRWDLVFYVNSPFYEVIFQSIVLECGQIHGTNIVLDSIEYKNTKYTVLRKPFYNDTEDPVTGIKYHWQDPWQPVWKMGKWYMSIKNATDENKVIQSQKLTGMWLRVTLRGNAEYASYVRSVLTKIANQPN